MIANPNCVPFKISSCDQIDITIFKKAPVITDKISSAPFSIAFVLLQVFYLALFSIREVNYSSISRTEFAFVIISLQQRQNLTLSI
jgi:hypothetical protein